MALDAHLRDARRELDAAYGALTPIKDIPQAREARKALIRSKNAIISALAELPAPQPIVRRLKGGMVVNAGNAAPSLLRQAGISHIAAELTGPNMIDLATTRWDGFVRGGMFISRGGDWHNEAPHVATIARDNLLAFVVIDTESHKADMGGSLDWTDKLFGALRAELGPTYPLFNITFGLHSSPAVVNHEAFRRHAISPIWEAYDSAGHTIGALATARKAQGEGWTPPHIAIGDKSILTDVASIVTNGAEIGDVWVWAPEQSGETIVELAKIPS